MTRKPIIIDGPPPILEIEEAEHAISVARSYIDIAVDHYCDDAERFAQEIDHARSTLRTLRKHFPTDWAMVALEQKIDDPLWGTWEPVRAELLSAINTQIVASVRKAAQTIARNRASASAPRQGRFPDWMKQAAIKLAQEHLTKTSKPIPIKEIIEHLIDEQIRRGEKGSIPTDSAVSKWMK